MNTNKMIEIKKMQEIRQILYSNFVSFYTITFTMCLYSVLGHSKIG